ncbi:DNA methyltransferase [Klebsiella phage VLCpiM12a]|uniref:DNA methyltransferase n=1 Tax=Klebsiella phage VLCpiM12a TaxID=2874879 RepID=UPI00233100E1|nr:DNA methyltransferase [Klebsiella phage VLCpiM12a]UVX31561.1 DNA methyltransferase [Klebsiella phage VLCpiM12a]
MSAQLQKSQLQMFKDLLNVTSSPESEDGHSHCNSQEYRQVQGCGPEVLRANHSVPQENNWDNSMSDTLLRCSSISSASAALQSSLGNKLRQQLENRGCAIYKLTWREKTTPSGLPYSQLVASVPRTSETDYSSGQSYWYTPTTNIFPQPDTIRGLQTLAGQAKHLTAWPTPTTRDHKDGKECSNVPTNSLLGREVWKSGWATPIVNDTTGSTHCYSGKEKKICLKLPGQVKITQPIRITASGQMLTGSDAEMESSGQLNPAHSRWLMGFPPEWDDCAVTAMQSSRKSQRNS